MIKSPINLEELKFWKAQGGSDLSIKLGDRIEKMAKSKLRRRLKFKLWDSGEVEFSRGDDQINFFLGLDQHSLLGYSTSFEHEPGELRDVSGLLEGTNIPVLTRKGKELNYDDLGKFPGYGEYTGRGKLLTLSRFETFLWGEGLGKRLLDFIKDQNYELIEGHAAYDAEGFWFNQGFVDSNLHSNSGEADKFVVWHNPKYR